MSNKPINKNLITKINFSDIMVKKISDLRSNFEYNNVPYVLSHTIDTLKSPKVNYYKSNCNYDITGVYDCNVVFKKLENNKI